VLPRHRAWLLSVAPAQSPQAVDGCEVVAPGWLSLRRGARFPGTTSGGLRIELRCAPHSRKNNFLRTSGSDRACNTLTRLTQP
jgi:hypothetical protein